MSKKINVAILGATGAVGEALLSILEQRNFPLAQLYPLASRRSVGESVVFKNKALAIIDAETFDFSKVDLAFFAAGSNASAAFVMKATEAGCIVIDKSSLFRYEEDVPLIIPEVNGHRIVDYKKRRIISNPNCSTIQLLVALKPLHDAFTLKRIFVATYQSVSGTGVAAVKELASQTASLLNGQPAIHKIYPVQIAFNVIPHIDEFEDNGFTKEEMKIVWESQKILETPLQINVTAVRVPVFYGHSEAVHIETEQPISAEAARQLLSNAPGIKVVDERIAAGYPTPVGHSTGTDEIYVGRIRADFNNPCGLNLWIVADNIRKGAALNSIQIAETLVKDYL